MAVWGEGSGLKKGEYDQPQLLTKDIIFYTHPDVWLRFALVKIQNKMDSS